MSTEDMLVICLASVRTTHYKILQNITNLYNVNALHYIYTHIEIITATLITLKCFDANYPYICDSSGVHRYTRWTGRLSHQTNNLSCPCNPLLKGCDPCLTQYWVQRDAGSDLPSWCQTTKVTLTKSSPERSGYMHMDKQITQSILVMLCSTKGTRTAKVEGLWLVNRPEC